MPERIDKVWGHELVLYNGDYCMKVLTLEHGYQSSLHMHHDKHETFLVVDGQCDIEVEGKRQRFVRGEFVVLPPGTPHRISGVDGKCVIVEASTHHDDTDVIRLEESRRIA